MEAASFGVFDPRIGERGLPYLLKVWRGEVCDVSDAQSVRHYGEVLEGGQTDRCNTHTHTHARTHAHTHTHTHTHARTHTHRATQMDSQAVGLSFRC